ncbi:hypothetical protein B2J88_44615 [Rhodococcus sp. SRB_17]|nr:hypothetical protein [Rhodococcus sp. SRB_17]
MATVLLLGGFGVAEMSLLTHDIVNEGSDTLLDKKVFHQEFFMCCGSSCRTLAHKTRRQTFVA